MAVTQAGSKRDHLAYYGSWSEYVDVAVHGKSGMTTSARRSRGASRGHDWDMGASWKDAVTMAEGGWAEGWESVTRMGAKLARQVTDVIVVPTVEYDVSGDYVDVGAFLAGEPECMGNFVMQEVERPVCHIVLNGIFSGGLSGDTMARRGAACLALVDALERSGRRCEVTLSVITGPGDPLEARVTLKRPDDTLNPGLLAFALCHPASSRRIGFSWLETLSASLREKHGIGRSYGAVVETDDQGDVYFGGLLYGEPQWNSDAAAEAWVLDELRRQGVELTEA